MPQLFFVNVPHDCSDDELKNWIESRGVETEAIRIVRDLVTGASPAFAYASLKDASGLEQAISALNGKQIRSHAVIVSRAVLRRLVN
jgi:RNA recognition motif-containing protein